MKTTYPRFENKGTSSPHDVLALLPDRTLEDEAFEDFASDSGFDGAFLAGVLSAFVAHERCGVITFRALQSAATNPMLTNQYKQFQADAEAAVTTWEELIETLGGNPSYVGLKARATEALDTKMLEALLLSASLEPEVQDATSLEITLLGAAQCVQNCAVLEKLVNECEDGSAKTALQNAYNKLVGSANEYLQWAQATHLQTISTYSQHSTSRTVMNKAEKLIDKIDKKLHQP